MDVRASVDVSKHKPTGAGILKREPCISLQGTFRRQFHLRLPSNPPHLYHYSTGRNIDR